MAMCVQLQPDGTLVPTGQAVQECTGYVLVSGSEYGVYGVVQSAFAPPTLEQASAWCVAAAGAVMFWYVVGRMAGAIANFFSR